MRFEVVSGNEFQLSYDYGIGIENYQYIINRVFPKIKGVTHSDPATIVFWDDGTKTVVKAHHEEYDPEKGLAMAIAKKALGNKSSYFDTFKEWMPKEEEISAEKSRLNKLAEHIKQTGAE